MLKPTARLLVPAASLLTILATLGATSASAQCPDTDSDSQPGSIIVPNRMAVNEVAAHDGNCGLEIMHDGSDISNLFVEDQSPADETAYRAAFWFNPNNFALQQTGSILDSRHFIFTARASSTNGGKNALRLYFLRKSGFYWLALQSQMTAGNRGRATPRAQLGPALADTNWYFIEIEWQESSGPGIGDGIARFRVDGGTWLEAADLKNWTQRLNVARLGAVIGLDTTSSGSTYFDTFESFRTLAP